MHLVYKHLRNNLIDW